MRFYLVDRITRIVPGKRIEACKVVSAFDPVLERDAEVGPVLAPMLAVEALAQASAWLVMKTTEFAQRGVLGGIRNITFGGSAPLGERLDLISEVESWTDEAVMFNFEAVCGGVSVVRAEGVLCFLLEAGKLEEPQLSRQHFENLLREETYSPEQAMPSQAIRWVGPPIPSPWVPYDVLDVIEPGKTASARKAISMVDPVFATHFPRLPVDPGVFLVQSLLEVGRVLLEAQGDPAISWRLELVRGVRFQRYVQPGDVLILNARLQKFQDGQAHLSCEGLVSGQQAVLVRTAVLAAKRRYQKAR